MYTVTFLSHHPLEDDRERSRKPALHVASLLTKGRYLVSLSKAKITITYLELTSWRIRIPSENTDSKGHFEAHGPQWGTRISCVEEASVGLRREGEEATRLFI